MHTHISIYLHLLPKTYLYMLYVLDTHIYVLHNTYIYVLGLLDRRRTDYVVVVTIRALLLNYSNS